jgi:uncharacterized protein DUF2568
VRPLRTLRPRHALGDDRGVSVLRPGNLALKFLLELGAVAAFAVFGAGLGDGAASALLALAFAGVAVVLWGIWAAPKSPRRLRSAARIPFELCFFALALAAFLARGLHAIGAIFGVAVVINAALLSVFGDWRE